MNIHEHQAKDILREFGAQSLKESLSFPEKRLKIK